MRVLDPTFLYDFPIVKPNDLPRKPYMLIYTYGYNNEEVAAIKNMAKKKGLLTIATGSLCPWADINMVVGSFEWLWLVKNADLIVTGTFHGSVSMRFDSDILACNCYIIFGKESKWISNKE